MSHLEKLKQDNALREKAFNDEIKMKECLAKIHKLNEHPEFLEDLEYWLNSYNEQ
jgi:hypothetical protein